MSDDKIAALLQRAQGILADPQGQVKEPERLLGLVSALVNALDSTVREMHARELHHFETEQKLFELDHELQVLRETTP